MFDRLDARANLRLLLSGEKHVCFLSGVYALVDYSHQVSRAYRSTEFIAQGTCDHWTYRLNWLDAQNASVHPLTTPSTTQYFGLLSQSAFR